MPSVDRLSQEKSALCNLRGTLRYTVFRRNPALYRLSQETCEVGHGERDAAALGGVNEPLFE